jgi:DHA1 family inner membrane transport protein
MTDAPDAYLLLFYLKHHLLYLERPKFYMELLEQDLVRESTPVIPQKSSTPIALFALTIGAFAIGTTEFVIMGLLPNVANNLNVSLPTAGFLVSGYALGVVVGAPIITAVTGSWPRKTLLLMLMSTFILGNLLSALAPNYPILLLGRIIASLAHGAFFGVGSVIAAKLVAPEKQAGALAMMFTGLTVANVLGVPMGTFLGQNFGWRSTFWMITVLGIIAIIGIIFLVPAVGREEGKKLSEQIGILRRPQIVLALLMTIFGFGGVFTVFTYITPMLQDITGFHADVISPILVLFGVGLVIGNIVGGKVADRWLIPSLVVIIGLLAIFLLGFTVTDHNQILMLVMVFLFGAAGFGTVPGLQLRVMEQAKDAPEIASAFNVASFNLGNAGGAFLGGLVIAGPLGLPGLPLAGAAIAIVGVFFTLWSGLLDKRAKKQ